MPRSGPSHRTPAPDAAGAESERGPEQGTSRLPADTPPPDPPPAHERPAYARASAPGPAAPIAPRPEADPPAAESAGDVGIVVPAREPSEDERAERPLERWLLEGQPERMMAPYEYGVTAEHHVHPWYKVMCLTGVDYFSTLGYQPGIAALAAGALSPLATLVLVLLTLLGALPIYRRVAEESPHGEGSIAMLERLLTWWQGKLFVLVLLGFVATDFVITITLSAADATAHLLENPFVSHLLVGQRLPVTLALLTLLGIVFLKGFKEAIGIAVVLVAVYLLLNVVVVSVALLHIARQPAVVADWQRLLFTQYGNPLTMAAMALLLFPKLALGMSGFETGVAVMPLVKGDPSDSVEHPRGRIRSTHRLLTTAALIMSAFLLASSFVTIALIPAAEFAPEGKANGRALAYLAHSFLGEQFGTVYDLSTILILWFAGASAMAGLLNIVPRYLPRYGMAPEWARAARPLVLVFTAIAFAVTLIFRADVDLQGGAYATGVLVLMTSASIAVTLAAKDRAQRGATIAFAAVSLVFLYTTVVNVVERPDGVKIATFFIVAIVAVSIVSRLWRQTELRTRRVILDQAAQQLLDEATEGELRFIAHDTEPLTPEEYAKKEAEQRRSHDIEPEDPIIFLEITVCDPSEFAPDLLVTGHHVGRFRVLRGQSAAVPNAIAVFLLYARNRWGKVPHVYFAWTEGSPVGHLVRYVLVGEGDIAPVTHEVLRRAEPSIERRPVVHVA